MTRRLLRESVEVVRSYRRWDFEYLLADFDIISRKNHLRLFQIPLTTKNKRRT